MNEIEIAKFVAPYEAHIRTLTVALFNVQQQLAAAQAEIAELTDETPGEAS